MGLFDDTKETATVSRLDANEDYQVVGTIEVAVQTLDAEEKSFFDGEISKGFKAYTPLASSIEQEDRIEVDSVVYDVKSIDVFKFRGFPHKKLIMEKGQQNASS